MIVGTIRNSVKQMQLENQWQQKKEEIANIFGQKKKETQMSAEEMQLNHLKKQAEQARESNKYAGIAAKIKSGRTLTPEEIEYLRENNPAALKAYEEIRQAKADYERKLRNCETQEEVERLKVQEMGGFLCAAKKVTNNPNIPKAAKTALLEQILAKVLVVQEAHAEFVKSVEFKSLPSEEEMKKEKREAERDESEADRLKFQEEMQEDTEKMQEELLESVIPKEEPVQTDAIVGREFATGDATEGSAEAVQGDVVEKAEEGRAAGTAKAKAQPEVRTKGEATVNQVVSYVEDYFKKESVSINRVDTCV